MYKIFLAWQSQNKATASFIKRQLDKVKDEFEHIGIEVEIIKSPTQDESGSPDIKVRLKDHLIWVPTSWC